MAEVKRINDEYRIIAPTITIDGDLQVLGTRTVSDVQDTTINDNTIILNSGETGAGITFDTSGIEIERGSLANVSFVYDETINAFRVSDEVIGLINIRAKTPISTDDNNTVATKGYVDNAASGAVTTAAGNNTEIQFNDSGAFGASSNLTWDGTTLGVTGDMESSGVVSGVDFEATGLIGITDFSSSLPSAVAGKTRLYAGTPEAGGTGLFFQNTTSNDELVSRRKAIVYGIIF